MTLFSIRLNNSYKVYVLTYYNCLFYKVNTIYRASMILLFLFYREAMILLSLFCKSSYDVYMYT